MDISKVITRFTTQYCPEEDRLFVICERETSDPFIIWLTQRLSNQLLRALFRYAEQISPGRAVPPVAHDMWRTGIQQAAQATLTPSQPPPAPPTVTARHLPTTVTLTAKETALLLEFKAADFEPVPLTLSITQMLQWLKVLHAGYARAQWPFNEWPEWFLDAAASNNVFSSDVVLH